MCVPVFDGVTHKTSGLKTFKLICIPGIYSSRGASGDHPGCLHKLAGDRCVFTEVLEENVTNRVFTEVSRAEMQLSVTSVSAVTIFGWSPAVGMLGCSKHDILPRSSRRDGQEVRTMENVASEYGGAERKVLNVTPTHTCSTHTVYTGCNHILECFFC